MHIILNCLQNTYVADGIDICTYRHCIYYAINRCVSIDDDNDVSADDELAIEEKLRIDMLIVHGTPSSLLSPASRLLRCHHICPVVELLPSHAWRKYACI